MTSGLIALTLAGLALLPGAGAATELRIGVVSRTIFFLPVWTAIEQGYFKDAGIEPKIEIYNDTHKIFNDLKAGTINIGITSIETAIQDGYKGGTLRIVAGAAQRPPHFIIVQPEIKSFADLKGKTFGVISLHEGTTFFVKDIARAGGFALADIKVEAVGGSPARARLLKERKIDAGLQPYPLSYQAELDGFNNLGPIAKFVPDYQFTSVMVDGPWASANRPVLVSFLRALHKGADTMFAKPDVAAAIGARELRTTPELARRALDDTARMDIIPRDQSASDLSLKKVFETMQEAGVMAKEAVYDRAKFVDDSYLNDSRR
jgi:ABC-type nitrate/sulfonate/bicarbonate transport system substrate-binding protein